MAVYKVASLYIECDVLPISFDAFGVHVDPKIDTIAECGCTSKQLKIHLSDTPPEYIRFSEKIAELQDFTIWKANEDDDGFSWLFVDNTWKGTMCIAADYSCAEFWFPYDTSWERKTEFGKVLFQVLVECKLLLEGYSVLHSACVSIGNEAYALAGESGIGKSTRAKRLIDLFSAEWISGDKPIIDARNAMVYGAPWDGKEHVYKNVQKPLKAVFMVKRSEKESEVLDMTYMEKYAFLSKQLFVPLWDNTLTERAFVSLKSIIENIPMYVISCDYTEKAMASAYNIIVKVQAQNK